MAASPGGRSVWVTFVEGGAVRALSFHPADGSIGSVTAFQLPDPANPTANSFVLPRGPRRHPVLAGASGGAAAGICSADCTAGPGTKSAVPGQGDSDASAALDGDGRTWLFANGTVAGNVTSTCGPGTRPPASGRRAGVWSPGPAPTSSRTRYSSPGKESGCCG